MLKDLLSLKFLEGYRTKIIGIGMILSGLAAIVGELGRAASGEMLNWDTLKGSGTLIATGVGLLTAAVHRPKP